MSNKSLPPNIQDYFAQNFHNEIFSEINYTAWSKGGQYDIDLIGNKHFKFNSDGSLYEFTFNKLTLEELPDPVRNTLQTDFVDFTVSNIVYSYTDATYFYIIYFANNARAPLYISSDGTYARG
jgi:hypothetical protein